MALRLNGETKQLLYIPGGFAHGFPVLSDKAVFSYKVYAYYHRESERTLDWNDKGLNIEWTLSEQKIQLTEKDRNGIPWEQLHQFEEAQWEA